MVHNPALTPPEQLVAQFVVRHEAFEEVMRVIRDNHGPSLQHLLVLGGRGFGKSTLAFRVIAEIQRDDTLSKLWLPLPFAEESYQIGDIGEFWLEALWRLADATGLARWHDLHGRLRAERDPVRLESAARAAIAEHATAVGRRVLLVVENLDLVLANLSEQDGWALRRTLQSDERFMLLATALRPFEGVTEYNQPFYEMLRQIRLEALEAEELRLVWRMASGVDPGPRRAQAIRVLSGGNPRLAVLLARFATGRSVPQMIEGLNLLVDEHTDYFKSNIEAMDGQNRRVFLALATLWAPATSSEVADEARLPVNVVSAVLGRLERIGRIEVVGKPGKNKRYQVAERLYNIYYLMRRRQGMDARLRAVLDFLVAFHEPNQLGEILGALRTNAPADASTVASLVDAVLGAVGGPTARAEVLAGLPADLLATVPPERLAKARKSPSELLALVQRADGATFWPDVASVMHRGPGRRDRKAWEQLRSWVWSVDDPRALRTLLGLGRAASLETLDQLWSSEELSDRARLVVAGAAAVRSLGRRDLTAALRWAERLCEDLDPTLRDLGAALALYVSPLAELPQTLPALVTAAGIAEPLVLRAIELGATAVLRALVPPLREHASESPDVALTLARALLGLGDPQGAVDAVALVRASGRAPAQALLAEAIVRRAADPDADITGLLRASIADQPTADALTWLALLVAPRNREEAVDLAKRATALGDSVGAWAVFANYAPELLRARLRSGEPASPPLMLAVSFASDPALRAEAGRAWDGSWDPPTDVALWLYTRTGQVEAARALLPALFAQPLTTDRLLVMLALREARLADDLVASLRANGAESGLRRLWLLALAPDPAVSLSAEEQQMIQVLQTPLDTLLSATDVAAPAPELPGAALFLSADDDATSAVLLAADR